MREELQSSISTQGHACLDLPAISQTIYSPSSSDSEIHFSLAPLRLPNMAHYLTDPVVAIDHRANPLMAADFFTHGRARPWMCERFVDRIPMQLTANPMARVLEDFDKTAHNRNCYLLTHRNIAERMLYEVGKLGLERGG